MSRFTWLDKAAVPNTGFQSPDEPLWRRLVSAHGMADPELTLEKMGLLTRGERGTLRATVAGLLLCAQAPETWLDHGCVTATCYRGSDRAPCRMMPRRSAGRWTSRSARRWPSCFAACGSRPGRNPAGSTFHSTATEPSLRPWSAPWRTATTRSPDVEFACPSSRTGWKSSRPARWPTLSVST